jgi:hypothetical protein
MKWWVLALAFTGCASTFSATPTSLSMSGRQAQLCLDEGAPRAGQTLRVQRTVCRRDERAPNGVACAVEPIAAGEVVRTVDDHCAVVRIASNFIVTRGDVIELGAPPAPALGTNAVAVRGEMQSAAR